MMTDEELMAAAEKAAENAYAPYSGFCVGAAILCRSGAVYTGANMENASYPAGICAESSALSAAVSAGEREFEKIAVWAKETAWPCGLCRQRLWEFGVAKVVLQKDGRTVSFALSELLPHGFRLNFR